MASKAVAAAGDGNAELNPAGSPVSAAPQVPLNEFCRHLSAVDRRVELIGGFYAIEAKAGNLSDTDAAYSARYEAFVNAPA